MTWQVTGQSDCGMEFTLFADYGLTGGQFSQVFAPALRMALDDADADRVFAAEDDTGLATGASITFDLTTILGPDGNAINLATVFAIYVECLGDAGNAGLILSGGASNPWTGPLGGTTPSIAIPPQRSVNLPIPAEGYDVTPGARTIKLANDGVGAAAAPYRIVIVGKAA